MTPTTLTPVADLPRHQVRLVGSLFGEYWHVTAPGGCQAYGGCHRVHAAMLAAARRGRRNAA